MLPYILVADDHGVVRTGLKLLLQLELGIPLSNIEEAGTCHEMMSKLHKKQATHLILDIILPDGNSLEVIPIIRKLYPDIKVLVFSMQPEDIYAEALKAFDIVYVSKSTENEKLIVILKKYIENKKIEELNSDTKNTNKNNFSMLTVRELQILHYILKGMNTKAISETLNLQMSTVSTFKKNIFQKTNTTNLSQLIELANLYNISY